MIKKRRKKGPKTLLTIESGIKAFHNGCKRGDDYVYMEIIEADDSDHGYVFTRLKCQVCSGTVDLHIDGFVARSQP